ncbi:DUF3311 domain-containing protein [Fodinicola acaciae]|uniref:DUF3311 domain-containing protein n=1 Tax=Fodinicola acaciae TaxID=2681555 RepID=UPI0013D83296|nr:DUF3311 domain-containing protein [Fodinicola acaciae]
MRRSLWWLLMPVVMFTVAVPFANRIEPVVAGLPFLAFWTLLSVVVTPVAIWLAARGDHRYRSDAEEPALTFGRSKDDDR